LRGPSPFSLFLLFLSFPLGTLPILPSKGSTISGSTVRFNVPSLVFSFFLFFLTRSAIDRRRDHRRRENRFVGVFELGMLDISLSLPFLLPFPFSPFLPLAVVRQSDKADRIHSPPKFNMSESFSFSLSFLSQPSNLRRRSKPSPCIAEVFFSSPPPPLPFFPPLLSLLLWQN